MAYQYDIFLSYPRHGAVGTWVHMHFLPVLQECLLGQMAVAPTIFVDTAQPTGVNWPVNLQQALLTSRLMVAIWTPPYFVSEWCRAEWASMRGREAVLAASGQNPPNGLVYPVRFSDGKHFDKHARERQYRDLSGFGYPYEAFKSSAAYLQFHDAVTEMAVEIEQRLGEVPPWSAGWPVIEGEPKVDKPMRLATL